MPAVEYPYAIVAGRRSSLIPLGLGFQGRRHRVQAYVDSGAFYSVFKTDFALALGLEWHQRERVYVQVGDEGGVATPAVSFRWPHWIRCSSGNRFNLIGRVPLFEEFVICFDDRQGIVRLEPYPEQAGIH